MYIYVVGRIDSQKIVYDYFGIAKKTFEVCVSNTAKNENILKNSSMLRQDDK